MSLCGVLHQRSSDHGTQTWKSSCLEMPANTLLVLRASAISSSSGEGCICMALHSTQHHAVVHMLLQRRRSTALGP